MSEKSWESDDDMKKLEISFSLKEKRSLKPATKKNELRFYIFNDIRKRTEKKAET